MGKGVAALFRGHAAYGAMVADYEERCAAGKVRLGEPYLWRPAPDDGPSQMSLFASAGAAAAAEAKSVLNFPTKDHWRESSRLSDIDRGLSYAAERHNGWGIKSMAVPALGCGNGRLQWQIVGDVLADWLDSRFPDVEVQLLPPSGATGPASEIQPGWVDMAIAMSEAAEDLAAGDGRRISVEAFAGSLARACGSLPGLGDARGPYFATVLQRLSDNGIVGYGLDLSDRRRQAHRVSALTAGGPAFEAARAWRRSQGDPDAQAISAAAASLAAEIQRPNHEVR